jgi:hypothetical protein
MGWASRTGGVLLGLAACGGGTGADALRPGAGPAPAVLAGACTIDGVRIEVEEGVLGGFGGETPCSYSGRFVAVWRGTYEERWGGVPLESWTVRIRTPDLVDDRGHAGLTWYDRQLIELSQSHFELLPHELHHAGQGAGSSTHPGWCADFVPWELDRHIQDERSRLGCAL